MAADGTVKLPLRVVMPHSSGEVQEFDLESNERDTGTTLKATLEKFSGVSGDDMELFFTNPSADAKQKWIKDEETLVQQGVETGATITVAVHGMRRSSSALADSDGEAPNDAVSHSLYARGDTSYYFAHAGTDRSALPAEHRIASGGPPQKISESEGLLPEPVSGLSKLRQAMPDGSARPRRAIKNYSWGDEKETVKIYISADSEPEAVTAAGSGKSNEVEVHWQSKSVILKILGQQFDYVLELEKLYYEIVPEECRFRVSEQKRLTLTLKKKEIYTWLKLLKPE